jgi:hypothetical protein
VPRKLVVEVVADAAQYYATLSKSSKAATEFSGDLKTLQAQAGKTAQVQVEAAVRQTEALRAEAAAFRSVAESAVAGSKEQVAAANLAANAERRLAAAMGVTASEAAALRKGSAANEIEASGRGALAASGLFSRFGRSIAFASGAFLGGAGLTAALRASVEDASNLNEQISKTNVVFGQSADEVKAWSETSARALGLAQDQALATASSFGALFKPMGLVGPEAARQSEALTQLGADLASFYNTDVQQALDAIKSGLVGESEPLRQYGILLSETRVQHEAMAETGKRAASELTDLDKVLARINLTLKDSRQAQGDFARTQGGLANQTRILKANLRDLAATVGGPVGSALEVEFRGWNKILGAINRVGDAQEKIRLDPAELRVVVPRLAAEYERLRAAGVGVAEAHKRIVAEFGDEKRGAELLGAALDYIVNPEMRAKVAKLQGALEGVGLAAEDAAKATSMIGIQIERAAAAAPRGEAALPPGQRLNVALARARLTKTTADDLKVLADQRALYAKQIASVSNRLDRATGKKARDLADQLQGLLGDDQAALAEITRIEQDTAARAAAAAKATEEAAKKHAEALKRIAAAHAKAVKAAAEAAKTARERKQFLALGLTATGEERVAGINTLRAELRQVNAAIASGLAEIDRNTRARLKAVGKILAGDDPGRNVRQAIANILDPIREGTKQADGEWTKFRSVNTKGFIAAAGLGGLGPRQRERLSTTLAMLGPGLTLPGSASNAFSLAGAGTTINIENFHSSAPDPRTLESELTKRSKARQHVRRGNR